MYDAERRPAGPEFREPAFSPDDVPLSAARALRAALDANGGRLTDQRIRQILRDHGYTLPRGPSAVARAIIYCGNLL